MSSNVFTDVPPVTGLFQSGKDGEIVVRGFETDSEGNVSDKSFPFLRVDRATFRYSNNAGLYYQAGKEGGISYAGNVSVSGQISNTFINEADFKLLFGNQGSIPVSADFETVLADVSAKFGFDSSYQFEGMAMRIESDKKFVRGYKTIWELYKVKFTSHGLIIPGTGMITAGPLRFIAKGMRILFQAE